MKHYRPFRYIVVSGAILKLLSYVPRQPRFTRATSLSRAARSEKLNAWSRRRKAPDHLSTLALAAALTCSPAAMTVTALISSNPANATVIDINDVGQFGSGVITYDLTQLGPPGNFVSAPITLNPSSGNNTGTLGANGQDFLSVNSFINDIPLLLLITGTNPVVPFTLTNPVSGVGDYIEGDGGPYTITMTAFGENGLLGSNTETVDGAFQTYIGVMGTDITSVTLSARSADARRVFCLAVQTFCPMEIFRRPCSRDRLRRGRARHRCSRSCYVASPPPGRS